MTRKTINETLLFEVFKRDSFTCQCCGGMSPDVILEVDHINPIAAGGDNDISNLITSCFDCNRGERKKNLTDKDEIKKQQEQLKEINEKRIQLQMMLQWKKELSKFEDEQVDEIEKILDCTGHSFSVYGRNNCKKYIKKYGFDEVMKSAEISLLQYYIGDGKESINKTFDYIFRICVNRHRQKENPLWGMINYIISICNKRYRCINGSDLKKYLLEYMEESDKEIVINMAKTSRNWNDFLENVTYYFGEDYGDF